MAHEFLLSSSTLTNGKIVHYAKLAGSSDPRFIIGYRTSYNGNFGLYNTSTEGKFIYNPEDYKDEKGFWAYFIYPTARAESKGSFFCINTYDAARFTFGFMQFAAHVPEGDFVKFFRSLLDLPNAKDYFPWLSVNAGHIWYEGNSGVASQMEDDTSTFRLMDYLNPSLSEIEHQELVCSARMVHWAKNDPLHIKVQVDTTIDAWKNNMIQYNRRFNLNGVPAKVCQLICDIRHQGRGKNDEIASALNTEGNWDKAFANLLLIGYHRFKSRIDTVKSTINNFLSEGVFDKIYDSSLNSFV
jgi:hypothetical protein